MGWGGGRRVRVRGGGLRMARVRWGQVEAVVEGKGDGEWEGMARYGTVVQYHIIVRYRGYRGYVTVWFGMV